MDYILLSIGSLFAVLYALVITVGWRKTRRNRRMIQIASGVWRIPVYNLESNEPSIGKTAKCVSLTANQFEDEEGRRIDTDLYDPYIAEGKSPSYPQVKAGNLMLFEKGTRNLKYIFEIPQLKDYR